jgi:SAM-dependent methyltransferase
MGKSARLRAVQKPELLKLDLGSGPRTKEGFLGVDYRDFGQAIKADLTKPWPWKDGSVEEIHCSHFLEHLDHNKHNPERVRFVNELYRVLVPGGKATIITPHWASTRAYGDFTHADKPVSEFWFYYLSRAWRLENAPDNDIQWNPDGYTCDFEVTWGYSLHPLVAPRNQEYQQHALTFWREAAQDMIATFTKRA